MDEFAITHMVSPKQLRKIQFTPLQRELMLKEIDFRIRENLNTIASLFGLQLLQAQKAQEESVFQMLQTNKLRINVFSLLQKLRYTQKGKTEGFVGYLRLLLDLVEEESGFEMRWELDIDDVALTQDQMAILGSVVSELYIDTLQRYSGPNIDHDDLEVTVKISLSQHMHRKRFLYQVSADAGIGWKEEKEKFCFKMAKLHAEHLKGDIDIEVDDGLRFCLYF